MRQFNVTILLILFLFFLTQGTSFGQIKGGIKYSIPVYYENLSESELSEKAESYFAIAKTSENTTIDENITNALFLYSVLENLNPNNTTYPIKLGILYDQIGKDRQAKGQFSRAIGIDSTKWEPYYYYGEFYYKRAFYRTALKYYKKAFERTNTPNYDLLFKIGDIYEKFGDSKEALIYLNQASAQNNTPELNKKIQKLQDFDSMNKTYYRD